MLDIKKPVISIALATLVTACSSTRELSPSISTNYSGTMASLTFSSPNFSAPHVPPLIISYAYVDTYLFNDFCKGVSGNPIAQSSVNKEYKVQNSKLPTGKVVAHIGYNASGAGSLTGDSYYVMTLKPSGNYKITLMESRPFVTSYSVTIESLENGQTKDLEAIEFERKKDVCG